MAVEREFKELKINVPWGHISGKCWGNPKNKFVLLVHGTLDNIGSFTRLIELLPNDYYYVGIDLPGHGLSSHFPSGINLDFFNFVLAIKYVLDELQWNDLIYIGHSFGGQLGIMFSIIYPGKIKKIITFDTILSKSVGNNFLLERIRQVMQMTLFELNKKPSPLYTKDQVLESLMNKRRFPINKDAALALFPRSVSKVGDKYQYNRDLRLKTFIYPNLNLKQYSELIKYLNVPVLIILAEDSWYKFKNDKGDLEFYMKVLPNNVKIKMVKGNHDVHNNHPERVAPHIIMFLENDSIKSKL